jgi:hypothetical protein
MAISIDMGFDAESAAHCAAQSNGDAALALDLALKRSPRHCACRRCRCACASSLQRKCVQDRHRQRYLPSLPHRAVASAPQQQQTVVKVARFQTLSDSVICVICRFVPSSAIKCRSSTSCVPKFTILRVPSRMKNTMSLSLLLNNLVNHNSNSSSNNSNIRDLSLLHRLLCNVAVLLVVRQSRWFSESSSHRLCGIGRQDRLQEQRAGSPKLSRSASTSHSSASPATTAAVAAATTTTSSPQPQQPSVASCVATADETVSGMFRVCTRDSIFATRR